MPPILNYEMIDFLVINMFVCGMTTVVMLAYERESYD